MLLSERVRLTKGACGDELVCTAIDCLCQSEPFAQVAPHLSLRGRVTREEDRYLDQMTFPARSKRVRPASYLALRDTAGARCESLVFLLFLISFDRLDTIGAGSETKPSLFLLPKKFRNFAGGSSSLSDARLRRKDAARTLVKAPHLCDANESRDREPARVGQRRRPLKAQAQNTDAKLNAILKHLNIEAPPTAAAAVAQQPLGSVAASAY